MEGSAEVYAKRQSLGEEAIGYAHAVKIEALSQLRNLLAAMPKNEGKRLAGRDVGGPLKELPKDTTPTLAELGIDKKTSMIAQQLAAMPEELREEIAYREKSFHEVRRDMKRAAVMETAALPEEGLGVFRVRHTTIL